MKMANIDAVFDFMFTKPRKPDEVSALYLHVAGGKNHKYIPH